MRQLKLWALITVCVCMPLASVPAGANGSCREVKDENARPTFFQRFKNWLNDEQPTRSRPQGYDDRCPRLSREEVRFLRDAPDEIAFEMKLVVNVHKLLKEVSSYTVCGGHTMREVAWDEPWMRRRLAQLEKRFSDDPNIEDFELNPIWDSKESRYEIEIKKRHRDRCGACNNQVWVEAVTREASVEEVDHWRVDDERMLLFLDHPDWQVVEERPLAGLETRTIDEREVTRECWRKRVTVARREPRLG